MNNKIYSYIIALAVIVVIIWKVIIELLEHSVGEHPDIEFSEYNGIDYNEPYREQ